MKKNDFIDLYDDDSVDSPVTKNNNTTRIIQPATTSETPNTALATVKINDPTPGTTPGRTIVLPVPHPVSHRNPPTIPPYPVQLVQQQNSHTPEPAHRIRHRPHARTGTRQRSHSQSTRSNTRTYMGIHQRSTQEFHPFF